VSKPPPISQTKLGRQYKYQADRQHSTKAVSLYRKILSDLPQLFVQQASTLSARKTLMLVPVAKRCRCLHFFKSYFVTADYAVGGCGPAVYSCEQVRDRFV
jgi:hypothetical protein